MQNCCISCCDSSKFANSQNITYFTFPINDELLMKQWITEIGGFQDFKDKKICSLHFLPEDIDYGPERRNPVLKSSAVPKLYLKQSIQSAISKKSISRVSVLRKHNKAIQQIPQNKELTTLQAIVQTSVTVTPTIIHQLPKVDHALLSVPYVSPRFRKILPKLDPIIKNNNSDNLQSVVRTDTLQGLPPQNPYIIIIPRIDNAKPSIPNNKRLSNVSKRKAILRITINKEYRAKESNDNSCVGGDNDLDVRKCQLDEKSGDVEQIEIKNHKLNRSVVFSLDPISGEILVTKRDIDSSKSRKENTGKDFKEDAPKEGEGKEGNDVQADLSLETAEELKNLCTKAEQDCNLVKQRLKNLREKQKDEAAEFEKLQEQLASLHSDSPNATSQPQSKAEKRKIVEESSSQITKKQKDESTEFEKKQKDESIEFAKKQRDESTEFAKKQRDEATELNVPDGRSEETLISPAEISISNNGWPNSFSIVTNHSISESDSITEKCIDQIDVNYHGFGLVSDTSVALYASNFDDPQN